MPQAPCIQYLQDFVAIPSVNPMGRSDMPAGIAGERRYAEHVREKLRGMGLDAEIFGDPDRPSVVAEARVAGALDTVLIASHLDTVPVDHMEIEPFDPVIKDGRLYGRGSCDTKAGMATAIEALERVTRNGTLRRNVILVGESDEELGSIGARDTLRQVADRGVDWAIATEPTELRIVTHHKGIAIARLVASGRAGHSSAPEKGSNAIYALAGAIRALESLHAELAERPDPILGAPTLSVGVVAGGAAPNIIPDEAWLLADRRLVPGDTEESVRAEIESVLSRHGVEGVRLERCTVEKGPLGTAHDHVSVQHLRAALLAQGLAAETGTVAFGTDAGVFEDAGLRGVVFGPGSIDRAHTAREYVELDQVEAATEVWVRLFEGDG
ncbi:MAG: M20 family metallopeptidase [Deltaproteobacteria bacterium]|nr:M20 family metallopeptidase [Deltaproteobacteria bacterium]